MFKNINKKKTFPSGSAADGSGAGCAGAGALMLALATVLFRSKLVFSTSSLWSWYSFDEALFQILSSLAQLHAWLSY